MGLENKKANKETIMKLKDMKYEIKGVDSNKPLFECLTAIISSLVILIIIAAIIRFGSDIDLFFTP